MTKLWSVKVNGIGWRYPRTLYATSREQAEELASKYEAADNVKYRGMFNDDNASFYLELSEYRDVYEEG